MSAGETMNTNNKSVKDNTPPGATSQQPEKELNPPRQMSTGTVGVSAVPPKRAKPAKKLKSKKLTNGVAPSSTKSTKTSVHETSTRKKGDCNKAENTTKTKQTAAVSKRKVVKKHNTEDSTKKAATGDSRSTNTDSTTDSAHSRPKSMAEVYVEEQRKYLQEKKQKVTTHSDISWPEAYSKTTKRPMNSSPNAISTASPGTMTKTEAKSSLAQQSSSGTKKVVKLKSKSPASTASSSTGSTSVPAFVEEGAKTPKETPQKGTSAANKRFDKSSNAKDDGNTSSNCAVPDGERKLPAASNNARDRHNTQTYVPCSQKGRGDSLERRTSASKQAQTTTATCSSSRESPDPVKGMVLAEEAALDNLARISGSVGKGKESTSRKVATQEPGAYRVQGGIVDRATSGILSPQTIAAQPLKQLHPRESSQQQPSGTSNMKKPSSKLVVAAELSSDAEAQIEEKARQRILQEAAQAEVISVNHDGGNRKMGPEELSAYKELHKPKGVVEKLFGDTRLVSDVDISASPECIRTRDVLKWTLRRNTATDEWVASVHTDQSALETTDEAELQKSLRSFVAPTQQEAHAVGLAMAAPRMLPYEENPICYICKGKFALLRRACHCRNCGVCICSACSTTWSAKRIPETYNSKNETQVKVCIACDWLSMAFREALEQCRYKAALNLYNTGNINVRMPFCNMKHTEVAYPIHVAVMGGDLQSVKWLAGERCCPLRAATKLKRKKGVTDGPLLTSKGRSPLGIALANQQLDIVHYLVAEKQMSFFEERNVSHATAMANFTSLLRMMPMDFFEGKVMETTAIPSNSSSSSCTGSFSGSLHSVPNCSSTHKLPTTDSWHSRSTACSSSSEHNQAVMVRLVEEDEPVGKP